MWEGGVRIYGILGVYNNFPIKVVLRAFWDPMAVTREGRLEELIQKAPLKYLKLCLGISYVAIIRNN